MDASVELTILVVSDYNEGAGASWEHIRATLAALEAQPGFDQVECIVVESQGFAAHVPGDLDAGARWEWVEASGSYALKNAGARRARGRHVAILDADCLPDPDWVASALDACRRYPEAAVISGRTRYAGRTASERCLALISRSYVDRGAPAVTRHISNNNAVYRRDWFLRHPLPEHTNPFSSSLQSESMRAAGGELRFEPSMGVTHAFEGWAMERDIRRNMGYATLMNRLQEPRLRHAWLLRLGWLSIPAFAGGRLLKTWWQCLHHGEHYGVRRLEQPLALGLAVVVTALEIEGMILAVRGAPVGATAYR